ncbi:MAG: DUF4886 domain-containing protein [Bacteroidota bacterium]
MMNFILKISVTSLLVLLLEFPTSAQDTTRILFIGNSLTFVNDLPTMFKSLAVAGGHEVVTDASVFGGYTFQMHFVDVQTTQKIQQGNWDYVVLQEQSQIPSISSYLPTEFYPYGVKLDSLIHVYNPAAKTVLFLTFAHKNGDEGILGVGGYDTYWLMQGRLRESYLHLADSIHAMVAPVGCAWREVRLADSTVELYGDPVHPSVAGTYLASCVFYTTLFQQAANSNSYTAGLDPTLAQFLQQICSALVTDSAILWNINGNTGIHDPAPDSDFDCLAYYNANCQSIILSWTDMPTGQYNTTCSNLCGQKVFEENLNFSSKMGNICLGPFKPAPGIYLIRVSNKEFSKGMKVICP